MRVTCAQRLARAVAVLHAARQRRRKRTTEAGVKVIVFGAGDAGTALITRLLDEPGAAYRPVALLDDDPDKRRLRVHGIPVRGNRARMAEVAAATGATVLVIAIAKASGTVIRDLTARAELCGLIPKVVPTTTELISGSARIEGVRDPRISDLLGRRPVRTDVAAIAGRFTGKRILVTGAGGFIGSELCRQLQRFAPAGLIMLDRDESALRQVKLTLHERALLDSDETLLADIRDPRRVREVFERFRPQIVFHAAALKHLPLLERSPAEAVRSNVLGTQAVLEAAAACGAESFVNISTDKAADPVSVLGYSKRIAERLTAHMAGQSDGSYLSIRFGDVLGSRGPVMDAGAGPRPAPRPSGSSSRRPSSAAPGRRSSSTWANWRGSRTSPAGCPRSPAARSTSSAPGRARARSWPKTCSGSTKRTTGRAIRWSGAPRSSRSAPVSCPGSRWTAERTTCGGGWPSAPPKRRRLGRTGRCPGSLRQPSQKARNGSW